MTELLCPKCKVPMDSFDRSGVTIEHCAECGGVFLDRGELERLEATEAATPADHEADARVGTVGAGSSGQALLGQLINVARQYKGRRRF